VARHRRRWRVWQRFMDSTSLVFLDESGASTNMARRYGWGPKGERLVDAVPQGHWKTTTLVAGLKATGVIAPLVLDGPITGEAFRIYVEDVLAPELEAGDAVVMDNLRVHKVKGVEEAIRAVGASVLHLPSYSPDLVWGPLSQELSSAWSPALSRQLGAVRSRLKPRRSEGSSLWRGPRPCNLVFGGSLRSGPMMRSCASAAELRGGGPILNHGWRAMFGVGLPPPRIVIGGLGSNVVGAEA
jgi:DDE superfamily endonuclease